MADNDPISSDSTPNKRRKLYNSNKDWDSQDDSGDELTAEDFHTVATLPLGATQQGQLQYSKDKFHKDMASEFQSSVVARPPSPARSYITQPTQPLQRPKSPLHTSDVLVSDQDVLVERSSPARPPPPPIRRAFGKPGSFLASTMAPPGTSFRRPLGVQSKPAPTVIQVDDDSEEDPPVHHSSDEETQGLSSNLKPTNFKQGGRGLDSTPQRSDQIVKESPKPVPPAVTNTFAQLMDKYSFSSSKPADDMVSAYGSASRRPRPPHPQKAPSRALPVEAYHSLEDIQDYDLREKVRTILIEFQWESVQRCVDALFSCKGNVQDAVDWLTADEEQDAPGEEDEDELASANPLPRRGVAVAKSTSQTQSSQPIRPSAKQEVKAPSLTIAEKYAPTQAGRRPSQPVPKAGPTRPEIEEAIAKPRRRLLQGSRPVTRSPTPPSSPPLKAPQPLQRARNHQVVTIHDSDSASDSDSDRARHESEREVSTESSHEKRLLKFFNECSVKDLADLSTQSEDVVKAVLDKRPFESLDVIRTISNTGKKSRSRPIGDKIVDVCSEMWTGYDAVDELVEECERLAKPIQEALKSWGVISNDTGELQLMNLDEAHDSGIGTPASSCPVDEGPTASTIDDRQAPPRSKQKKGRFLGQPESMNPETTLKDYQLVGLNWLNLMWSKATSGCILADDMGLGKTCQAIAFLAHLQQQNVDGVHLVIVPGSTLENWLREFALFAPQLRVVPYYGSQAERPEIQLQIEEEFSTIDVIVTTYDMAVSPADNKFLCKQVDPLVCIYDEAHALRNPKSQRYQKLTRIPARFRVLLTGTPLQNNLQELVAILAFIMPELFAEKSTELGYIFKHKASTKDADHAALLSAQRITRARSMMTPFILRRKKQQVLDLPAKHSRVEYCEMTASQADYYADLLEEAQKMFSGDAQSKKGNHKAGSQVLMALRQGAIHPLLVRRLYDDKKIDKIVTELLKHPEFAGNDRERTTAYLSGEHYQSFKGGDYGLHKFCALRPYLRKFELKKKEWMDSGKISKFRELIPGFTNNENRVLVFSQFTTMMDILEAVLETLGIKYMRLDGSTDMQIRQDMIDKFTTDESIKVFMLSTKAGGAGINLACANKVIIFDSGFNPQDDIQAENRAHRVGQTREVEVVRFVTRGTIEEQIYSLGESKLALDERVSGERETAEDEKKAEKVGEQMVEKMFLESLKKPEEQQPEAVPDLKEAFKIGLEGAGVKVSSKQAQF